MVVILFYSIVDGSILHLRFLEVDLRAAQRKTLYYISDR